MQIIKTSWRRKLISLFCAILIFSTFMVPTAFADDVHIFTAYQPFMYFEKFDGSSWGDLGTPPHSVVETGQPAYCLQMSMESPYGDGYDLTDGSVFYSPAILNGLKAILAHGYPASTGGFTDNEAQYATANAIRFFLAENGIQEMPAYLRDTGNARAKPGYESLFAWCLQLLEYGRHPDTNHSISFSSSDLTLESQDYSFVGNVRVTCAGLSGSYTLDSSALPAGSSVTGYTGNSGDTLHISIPEEYEESTYTLWASGMYDSTDAVLYFYAPTTDGQQRVVTCTIDMQSTLVDASMTVRTPKAPIRTGNIELSKVDENGEPVPGIRFALYDSAKQEVTSGVTDANGKTLFADIPIGDYYYAETATLPHLVLDPTLYPVSITEGGQTVKKTATNEFIRGHIKVLKTSSLTGEALPGVHFVLYDTAYTVIAEGDSGADGTLIFTDVLYGDYILKETATVIDHVLDETEIPISITENGQTIEISRENDPVRGNLKIVKKIGYEETPLSGVGFRLFDGSGNVVAEGYTDQNGELLFEDLLYGLDYSYQEFSVPKGFVLDETVYPLAITENGVTVTKTHDNFRREGTLQVLKQDHQGNPLSGTTYLLEYSGDNGNTWAPVFSRESGNNVVFGGCTSPGLTDGLLTTGSDGLAVFTGLRADGEILYRVTETAAPPGYSLLADPLYVGTLPVTVSDPNVADSETVDGTSYTYSLYITATDNPIFRLPEAGSSELTLLPFGLLLLAVPFYFFKSKKETEYEID